MKSIAIGIVAAILKALIGVASPILRTAIADFIHKLEDKAAATPNTFDDALVKLLIDLLKVDD